MALGEILDILRFETLLILLARGRRGSCPGAPRGRASGPRAAGAGQPGPCGRGHGAAGAPRGRRPEARARVRPRLQRHVQRRRGRGRRAGQAANVSFGLKALLVEPHWIYAGLIPNKSKSAGPAAASASSCCYPTNGFLHPV